MHDNCDIMREVCNMYASTNMLVQRLHFWAYFVHWMPSKPSSRPILCVYIEFRCGGIL